MKNIFKLFLISMMVLPLSSSATTIYFRSIRGNKRETFEFNLNKNTYAISGKKAYKIFNQMTKISPENFTLITSQNRKVLENSKDDIFDNLDQNSTLIFSVVGGTTLDDILRALGNDKSLARVDIGPDRFYFKIRDLEDKDKADFYQIVSNFVNIPVDQFTIIMNGEKVKKEGRIFPVFLNKFKDKVVELSLEVDPSYKVAEETDAAASRPLDEIDEKKAALPFVLDLRIKTLEKQLKDKKGVHEAETYINSLVYVPDIVKIALLEKKLESSSE